MRHMCSKSAPPISAKDEELGYIPDDFAVRSILRSPDEYQSRKFPVCPNQKRSPIRIAPIEREFRIPESSIRAYLTFAALAEIVNVQLKQVGED